MYTKIDLHMHSVLSDGTDTPEKILSDVREGGFSLFSLTDHDGIQGCETIRNNLSDGDPDFISGVEFSCMDDLGKYHILGYGFDSQAPVIRRVISEGHQNRIEKLRIRLNVLKVQFNIDFPLEDIERLYQNTNPGKPHIARLMVKYGYADSMKDAFIKYLNGLPGNGYYILPETAITAILESGGIPILAHPSYGSGDELIIGTEMEERLRRMMDFGIRGLEAYYSGFTPKLQNENLSLAEKYDLYVTAGSDYHGTSKMIRLGDNHLDDVKDAVPGLQRFIEDVPKR